MYLDRDFDRGDARRRLLRIHELGHALGYQHVRSRTSIMNPAIGSEPTDFDRAGASIAFQRPIGNRAPDIDPSPTRVFPSVSEGGSRWVPPIFLKIPFPFSFSLFPFPFFTVRSDTDGSSSAGTWHSRQWPGTPCNPPSS